MNGLKLKKALFIYCGQASLHFEKHGHSSRHIVLKTQIKGKAISGIHLLSQFLCQ